MTLQDLAQPLDRRALLRRRIRLLVAATITYNVIEAAVALTAGTMASSAALIGFGLDSIVEVASATAVAWQFAAIDHERPEHLPFAEQRQSLHQRARRGSHARIRLHLVERAAHRRQVYRHRC